MGRALWLWLLLAMALSPIVGAEPPETPVTEPASDVANTAAIVHGMINPGASFEEVQYYFAYNSGSTCTGGSRTALQTVEGNQVEVLGSVKNLKPQTEYSICLVAEHLFEEPVEERVGNSVSFTTMGEKPVISEESFSGVDSSEATLSAKIDAKGLSTTFKVEYGAVEPFGASASASLPAAEGPVGVLARLTGLQPNTLYHFRFTAQSALGSTRGEEGEFQTSGAPGPASLALPDDRAYELVSPPVDQEVYVPASGADPGEAIITEGELTFRAATEGGVIAYAGDPPASGEGGNGATGKGHGNEYLAQRGDKGWQAEDVTPPASNIAGRFEAFSPDLSLAFLQLTFRDAPLLGTDAPPGCEDLYTRASSDGSYQALFGAAQTSGRCKKEEEPKLLAGASADESHVIFQSTGTLTDEAAEPAEEGQENLYESIGGDLRSVNVLGGLADPNATLGGRGFERVGAFGETVGYEPPDLSNAISADGTKIFWTDLNDQHVYVRENGTSTVPVSVGAAQFWTASADGRFALYTEAGQLWRFDVQSKTREALTAADAEVQGVVGASEDGSSVYFVAFGALAGANGEGKAPAPPAAGEGALTEGLEEVSGVSTSSGAFQVGQMIQGPGIAGETTITAVDEVAHTLTLSRAATVSGTESFGAGLPNLYVDRLGVRGFVATLAAGDNSLEGPHGEQPGADGGLVGDWRPDLGARTAEVSADGEHLVFDSTNPLSGYDNNVKIGPLPEVFVYDAQAGRLTCASCNPSGAAPVERLSSPDEQTGPGEGRLLRFGARLPASSHPTYMMRWLSEDGSRVFFDTGQPLVPQDTNGRQDIYEWEREGAGSCPAGTSQGCIYLLSGGNSIDESYLVDASANGDDVFFTTRGQLLPAIDRDSKVDLYDARVDGGFTEVSLACTGTGCQGVPPAPPSFATPPSATFSGIGNFPAPTVVKAKPKSKPLTRAQKLAKALKACAKKPKKRRAACRAQAERRYGPVHKAKRSKRRGR